MGNRISTTPNPVIMTKDFLEEKMISDMVQLKDLDRFALKKLLEMDDFEWESFHILELQEQNLVNISDLWRFSCLTILEMPDNLIEKIEGLEKLANLEVLDLSFNFIKCIEGLEELHKLKYLNLTGNEITKLENLEHLNNLETLLVRHNKIQDFNSIYQLAEFKNLSSLGIKENPVMEETDAHFHVISILPQLKVLDFNLISEQDLLLAVEKFPIKNTTNRNLDASETQSFDDAATNSSQNTKPSDKDAYVDGLIGGKGYKNLISSDRNFELLLSFPPVSWIAGKHQLEINAIFEEWYKLGHNFYQKISEEMNEFLSMVEEISRHILDEARIEEENLNNHLKEELPKQLCLIYHKRNILIEEDEISKLRETCLVKHQKTLEYLLNLVCMKVGLLLSFSKIFEDSMRKIFENYIYEVTECCKRIVVIDQACASELRTFYDEKFDTVFEIAILRNKYKDILYEKPSLKLLLQKKEFVATALDLSTKIHSVALDGRVKKLECMLHNSMNKILDDAIENKALKTQDEQVRNIIVFSNKQKLYIEKLFSENTSFKHHLGYK